ncbi:MAG: sigma 54-interacting transcriptional regulator, partial [Sutterellaceae bacterium]|nr:sigma 54-interacting transcriptional regulator [Sutterellaceae bacterium]
MKQIWVVDDDRSIRWVLEKALTRAQMPFALFESAKDVVEALKTDTPSVLLSDIRMHDMNGVDLLAHVKETHPEIPVIIMTAFSDLDSAVSAFQGGAYEYLAKPFDINRAVKLLRRACEESERNEAPQDATEQTASEIIGHSRAMQEVFRAIGRLAQSNVTVLLTGESGTGKEVVARALHCHSLRRNAPFVAINTAAIPRELLESELFGHERGAFTGANQ